MGWPWRRRAARHAVVPQPRSQRWAGSWATPARPPEQAVRLGFTDGSEVELAGADPRAVALRAVADLLVQAQPEYADTQRGESATFRRNS